MVCYTASLILTYINFNTHTWKQNNNIFSASPDWGVYSNRLLLGQFLLPAASDSGFLILQVGPLCKSTVSMSLLIHYIYILWRDLYVTGSKQTKGCCIIPAAHSPFPYTLHKKVKDI